VKISSLRTIFHSKLSHLYEEREIEAIFFTYIEDKYHIKRHQYFLNTDDKIDFKNTDIEALTNGTPIQYVTGKTTFCGLQLAVNPSVLIPRPETEELVALVLKNSYALTLFRSFALKLMDLCTGSGAIAIALSKKIENVEVWATDISEDALKTAKKNANAHQVEIHFLQHDILNDNISFLPDNVDIIVSNPPYIPMNERSNMHKNVVDFEPNSALFVPDENPLVFYNAIAKTAKKILRSGGVLYFETHEKFHLELTAMLSEEDFKDITLWNDINGKPRFASGKKL